MQKVLAFTGAGISQQVIPTFEEQPWLREVLTLKFFEEHYKEFWKILYGIQKNMVKASPTTAHKLLASHGARIVTMNIDGLHTMAGSQSPIEVHGNLEKIKCTKCGIEYPFDYVHRGEICESCGSKLRPKIALYGDIVPEYGVALQVLERYAGEDVLIIGTSFATEFATIFCEKAKKIGANVIIMNENANEQVAEYFIQQEFR